MKRPLPDVESLTLWSEEVAATMRGMTGEVLHVDNGLHILG